MIERCWVRVIPIALPRTSVGKLLVTLVSQFGTAQLAVVLWAHTAHMPQTCGIYSSLYSKACEREMITLLMVLCGLRLPFVLSLTGIVT